MNRALPSVTGWAARIARLGRKKITLKSGGSIIVQRVGGKIVDASHPRLMVLVEDEAELWWSSVEIGKPIRFVGKRKERLIPVLTEVLE